MADANAHKAFKRQSSDEVDPLTRKKVKTESPDERKVKAEVPDLDKKNPYLAHMYEHENENGYSSRSGSDPFANFNIRNTTAKDAEVVEDLDDNAFTGKPHSSKYFDILRVRRDLPVHKQR